MKKLSVVFTVFLVFAFFASTVFAQHPMRPDKKPNKDGWSQKDPTWKGQPFKPRKHKPEPKKEETVLGSYARDISERLRVLDKRLKELWKYVEELVKQNRKRDAREFRIVAEAVELAMDVMREQLEGAKREMRWREQLPPEIREKINNWEKKIRAAYDKGDKKLGEKLERELDKFMGQLHEKFRPPEAPNEIPLEEIFKLLPDEVQKQLEKLRRHIEELKAKIERNPDNEEVNRELRDKLDKLHRKFDEIVGHWTDKLIREGKLHPEGQRFRELSDDEIWERLPKELRKKVEKMKMRIKKAFDDGRLDEGEELAGELEKLWREIKERFGRVPIEPPHHEPRITDEQIWRELPPEIRKRIEALKDAARELDENGQPDLADELMKKAEATWQKAKREFLEKLKHNEEREKDLMREWWRVLPEEDQRRVNQMREQLEDAMLQGEEDRAEKLARALREYRNKAMKILRERRETPNDEGRRQREELERFVKKLDEKIKNIEKDIRKLMRDPAAQGKVEALKKKIKRLIAQKEEALRRLKETRREKPGDEGEKNEFDRKFKILQAQYQKFAAKLQMLRKKLQQARNQQREDDIEELEKAIDKLEGKLVDVERQIERLKREMHQRR